MEPRKSRVHVLDLEARYTEELTTIVSTNDDDDTGYHEMDLMTALMARWDEGGMEVMEIGKVRKVVTVRGEGRRGNE